MTNQEQLQKKLQTEYDGFLNALYSMSPIQVVDRAYEKVIKEEILCCFTGGGYPSEDEAKLLLEQDFSLEDFYGDWMNSIFNTNVVIEESVGITIEELVAEAEKGNLVPVVENKTPELNRFMDVDLVDFLRQIADKTIIHFPADFNYDVERFWKVAIMENPQEHRLAWHCSSMGTHTLNERDVFIKNTGDHNYWVDYRVDDPDMVGYIIEITGYDNANESIKANVFEVGNYAEHAKYVRETAIPFDSVSLTYSSHWGINSGKTITVPRTEYDNDRSRLMSESGNVQGIKYHPANELQLDRLLENEHAKRMEFPIGDVGEHVWEHEKKVDKLRPVSLHMSYGPKANRVPRKSGALSKSATENRMINPAEKVEAGKTTVTAEAAETTVTAVTTATTETSAKSAELVPTELDSKAPDEQKAPKAPKPTKAAQPSKPGKQAKKPSFDDVLKAAQEKADKINKENSKGKQQSPVNKGATNKEEI